MIATSQSQTATFIATKQLVEVELSILMTELLLTWTVVHLIIIQEYLEV